MPKLIFDRLFHLFHLQIIVCIMISFKDPLIKWLDKHEYLACA